MDKSRYSGKIRIRSCGILVEDQKILLVKLHSPVTDQMVWLPPGGKVKFGESLNEALKREFNEETGLDISVHEMLHVNELIEKDIHAIEFYYKVQRTGGEVILGTDPEISEEEQIISDIKFFSKEELKSRSVGPTYIQEDLWKALDLG